MFEIAINKVKKVPFKPNKFENIRHEEIRFFSLMKQTQEKSNIKNSKFQLVNHMQISQFSENNQLKEY